MHQTKAISMPLSTSITVPFAMLDANVMSVPTLFITKIQKGAYGKFVGQSFLVGD